MVIRKARTFFTLATVELRLPCQISDAVKNSFQGKSHRMLFPQPFLG